MKLPRRNFLHLAANAAALPTLSRVARAQAYPTRPVRLMASRDRVLVNRQPRHQQDEEAADKGAKTAGADTEP
jgi:hypothetical protein